MKTVVTGGAGFIGSHLVDALVKGGDDVVCVDNLSSGSRNVNRAARFADLDVLDRRLAQVFEGASVVFHLAAQTDVTTSMRYPPEDCRQNVLGTVSVLEAARHVGARVVFASSGGAIYGECVTGRSREGDALKPTSFYGLSKLCGERYVRAYREIFEAENTVLRLANVYGERQRPTLEGGVVALWEQQMLNDSQTYINGDGSQTRDFVHVSDVVAALVAVKERPGTFNVGTGVETSVAALHAALQRRHGAWPPMFKPRAEGDLMRSVVDPGRLEAAVGWKPNVVLSDWIAGDRVADAA